MLLILWYEKRKINEYFNFLCISDLDLVSWVTSEILEDSISMSVFKGNSIFFSDDLWSRWNGRSVVGKQWRKQKRHQVMCRLWSHYNEREHAETDQHMVRNITIIAMLHDHDGQHHCGHHIGIIKWKQMQVSWCWREYRHPARFYQSTTLPLWNQVNQSQGNQPGYQHPPPFKMDGRTDGHLATKHMFLESPTPCPSVCFVLNKCCQRPFFLVICFKKWRKPQQEDYISFTFGQ